MASATTTRGSSRSTRRVASASSKLVWKAAFTARTVSHTSHAAGALRDRAADRAQEAARRIRREEESLLPKRLIEVVEHDAGLHLDVPVHRVDFQDPVEALHVQDDRTVEDDGPREAGPGPAGADGHATARGDVENSADLLLGRGAGYDRRGSLEVRHVLPESLEGTGLGEDVFRSDDRTQFRGQPENTRTRGHRGK